MKTPTMKEVCRALGDLQEWNHNCHMASIHLVKRGIGYRVARGFCAGVGLRQHSWVVCGPDCYDLKATIIDPTLWSWRGDVHGPFIGSPNVYNHKPHGYGNIWKVGKPIPGSGKPIKLKPKHPFSEVALTFLDMIGPMDVMGWKRLSDFPVQGWPSTEIISAIQDTLPGIVSIDILGMLTDRNPQGLYLK